MYNRNDTETNESQEWKFWIIFFGGLVFSGLFGFIKGADKVVDQTQSYDFQVGTVMGSGLAVGLIVWLIIHFLAIRAASSSAKWMVFLSIAVISMFAALLGWTLNAS